MGIIGWIVFGFIIGLLARALVPGRQKLGIIMTTLLGIAGSIAGGLVASAFGAGDVNRLHGAGLLGSLLGAVVLLLIATAVTRRRAVA